MFIVDSREPKYIVDGIRAAINDEVMVSKLKAGDLMDPALGLLIERKSATDLLRSISDGALMSQCARIIDLKARYPVLLVHGSLLPDKNYKCVANGRHTRWNYWSVEMTLLSVQFGGVGVLIVPDRLLFDAIIRLRSYAAKRHHRIVRSFDWQVYDPALRVLTVLAGDVGKARALLNEYVTPMTAIEDVENWERIKGIGPATVNRAINILLKEKVDEDL